jgi:hypothetical protein
MTPSEIIEVARNNLNAVTDTLWSDAELLKHLDNCQRELARKTRCIENVATDTSVASQSDYTWPTRAIDILRITFDGTKLQRISFDEYDQLGANLSGTPAYYMLFNDTVTLVPTPDSGAASKTIKFYVYSEPSTTTLASTLEVPTIYHDVLCHGVTYHMCPKDLGHPLVTFWRDKWFTGLAEVEHHVKLRKRADGFSVVVREEDALTSNFGVI